VLINRGETTEKSLHICLISPFLEGIDYSHVFRCRYFHISRTLRAGAPKVIEANLDELKAQLGFSEALRR
jgi:hypothetical protein